MKAPKLKQNYELSLKDFVRCPVWRCVHGVDQEEAWYDRKGCNEQTYRPWEGALPAEFGEARLLLVSARFAAKSGEVFSGSCYSEALMGRAQSSAGALEAPRANLRVISAMQPVLFLGKQRYGFWGGMAGIDEKEKSQFQEEMSKKAREIFPICFEVLPGLTTGTRMGLIPGFCRLLDGKRVVDGREAKTVKRVEKVRTKSVSELLDEVNDLKWSGQVDEAIRMASELVLAYPMSAEVWSARSNLYKWKKDIRAALADALVAIQIDPADPMLYRSIAWLHFKQSEHAKCIEAAEGGLAAIASLGRRWRCSETEDDLQFLMARTYFEIAQFRECLSRLEKIDWPGYTMLALGAEPKSKKELTRRCKVALRGGGSA